MNYGSAGTGANSQLVNVLMNQALNIEMAEVPYRGTAPALNDLAAGHVDALVDAMARLLPLHRDGRIKILGNFDDTRSPGAQTCLVRLGTHTGRALASVLARA